MTTPASLFGEWGAEDYDLTEAEVLDTLEIVVAAHVTQGHSSADHGGVPGKSPDLEASSLADAECDAGASSSTSSSISSTVAGASQPAATARKAPSSTSISRFYQNRQKQELQYLKTKVRELERQLALLERERDAHKTPSVWQRVAQQQSLERQKSLSENTRLKASVEEQLRFASTLEKILRKRPRLSVPQHRSARPRRVGKGQSHQSLYEDLSIAADREYRRMGEVLDAAGVFAISGDHRALAIRTGDEGLGGRGVASLGADLRVEKLLVRRYPFPVHAVGRELWKFLSYASNLESDGVERNVDLTDDSLLATTSVQFPVGDGVCCLRATALLRQYVQEDQFNIVWISDGECEPKHSTANTFKLDEVGWVTIRPSTDDPAMSTSWTFGISTPSFSERVLRTSSPPQGRSGVADSPTDGVTPAPVENAEEIGILTELLGSVYARSEIQMQAAIENALMNRHLEGKEITS